MARKRPGYRNHWLGLAGLLAGLNVSSPLFSQEPAPSGTASPGVVKETPAVSRDDVPLIKDEPPSLFSRPLSGPETPEREPLPDNFNPLKILFAPKLELPTGYTGRSSIRPDNFPTDLHFIPLEDRWRSGMPTWDRYEKGHPNNQQYLFDIGQWYDPYRQNVIKGDYPILGQNTFLDITLTSFTLVEPKTIPAPTTPFESTARPLTENFFGNPNQIGSNQFITLGIDLFHGDAAFKPVDWRIKLTPIFNVNVLTVEELALVNPDVRAGTQRERTYTALEEWFVEKKIADWGPYYDFTSVRVGSQFFVSDFRGLIFNNVNRGARVFGSADANQIQYNMAYFNMLEKDTNSGLNTFDNRHQQVVISNLYYQDFLYPGYTAQASFHYNHDDPTFLFNNNNFLVRPDPVGVFKPHTLDVFYLGWAGDGHINRFNINHAFYTALGSDTRNPLANQAQSIMAYLGALELSYDRDYARFRVSYFFASGDGNPNNGHATGFDSIFDRQNFAGSFFSWWGRSRVPLFGVGLKQEFSLLPDLRSTKNQGQSNFVNPGLSLINLGFDLDLTPKIKLINNCNFMWFDKTASLEQFVYQGNINRQIGTDLSVGLEYRPLLNNNLQFTCGVATFIPGDGFKDLYNNLTASAPGNVLGFTQMTLQY